MKIPKYKGSRPSTYIFSLVCFFIGIAFLTATSVGQFTYDDREGPGFNPFSRMPDGKPGISEFAIMVVGFAWRRSGSSSR
jgi:hypothetical protein